MGIRACRLRSYVMLDSNLADCISFIFSMRKARNLIKMMQYVT